MIINHNMMSMNAQRSLSVNSGGLSRSIEKLSTGQRVNRAADDAAGLTISEKMRTQVRGLTQASRNSQDGISAVQTAEGALDEVHSMLQRMRELTVQAGNDTNQKIDREAISKEIAQLGEEIQSISGKTEFNKQKLLDGSFADKKLQVGANQDQTLKINIDSMSGEKLKLGEVVQADVAEVKAEITSTNDWVELDKAYKFEVTIGDVTKTISMDGVTNKTKDHAIKAINDAFGENVASLAGNKIKITAEKGVDGETASVKVLSDDATKGFAVAKNAAGSAAGTTGVTGRKAGDWKSTLDVSSSAKANETLGKIDNAINTVSEQRSSLGAVQNRLEHTIRNLDNAAENTQAAESRIRDTDMAKEMSTFTKNNVLSQAAQAMISQANQLPSQALQLLR